MLFGHSIIISDADVAARYNHHQAVIIAGYRHNLRLEIDGRGSVVNLNLQPTNTKNLGRFLAEIVGLCRGTIYICIDTAPFVEIASAKNKSAFMWLFDIKGRGWVEIRDWEIKMEVRHYTYDDPRWRDERIVLACSKCSWIPRS